MSKLIVNCETGEEIVRELNTEELAQQSIDEANTQAEQVEAETKQAQRVAIADRLGLTAEELQVLLG